MKVKDERHLRKCRSCRFFVQFANDEYVGRCHRNSPLPTVRGQIGGRESNVEPDIYVAPIVLACFWCGQYEEFKRSR